MDTTDFNNALSSLNDVFREKERVEKLSTEGRFASRQYEYLKCYIKRFEAALDEEHEVAIRLASFGSSILMKVLHIGYEDPSLLVFLGTVDGNKTSLIQNVNQLNFLLMAVPVEEGNQKRPIGFERE